MSSGQGRRPWSVRGLASTSVVNHHDFGAYRAGINAHLLPQNEVGILVVCILAGLELGDACALLFEFLVVAFLFFDVAVEHRCGDYERRRGGHFDVVERRFSFVCLGLVNADLTMPGGCCSIPDVSLLLIARRTFRHLRLSLARWPRSGCMS